MCRAVYLNLRCAFLALFFCCNAWSQIPPLKFITYTTEENLLHNYTKKCVEDPKGFLWIISETGLSRFDGVNFKNFQHDVSDPSSLPHNTIHDLGVDNDGTIWLALENGLSYFNPKEFCFTPIDVTGTFINSPAVLSLCVDPANEAIWFMTDKALYRLNTRDKTIHPTSCKNPTPTKINSIYRSADNRLWIACYRHGFILYDIAQNSARQEAPETWAMSFFEDGHTMWISSWHTYQLMAWDMVSEECQYWKEKDEQGSESNRIITSIAKSPMFNDGMLMISTVQSGIRMFDVRKEEYIGGFNRDIFSKYSLPTDFINYIFADSHGIIWFCTWEGLCKVNVLEQQFRSVEIPFLSTPMFQYYNLIEGIVEADEPGVWWLGVNGCGLIKYDTAKKQLLLELLADINQPNLFGPGSWTELLIKTEDGKIWSSNQTGLASLEGDILTQYPVPANTFRPGRKSVCIGPDNTLWLTTVTHLFNFDPVTKSYRSFEIDTAQHGPIPTRSVAESGFCSDGNIWTGTLKGLYQFNVRTHHSRRIQLKTDAADSLSINTINSLVTDGHETVYMGTPAGLGIYNIHTGDYQLKGQQEQVFPVLWKSMLHDKAGNIWIYTTHALFKYDPQQDKFSKFTMADGIYSFSSDPTHLFSFRNNFYIGYRGAYTEFDPLKVNVNQASVKPIITDVHVESTGQRIDPEEYIYTPLSLQKRTNDINIHFTGIDYTNSERITFSYKLEPHKDWHDIGKNRSLSFSNLPPGKYNFHLRAFNSSGILSEQNASFKFSIEPSLVQRWWFWPGSAFAFVTSVLLIANKRIKHIREEERIKTETNKILSQLETRLLRSQMNPHFIFNSLNSIQKYIWENKEEDAAEYLARFAKLIRAILENSRKEFITLHEELRVLKLYVDLEHRRSNGKFDYVVRTENNINLDEILIPPLLLQPYIENAIWHGVNKKQGQGHIDIHIALSGDMLICTIDDDGVGRTFNQPAYADTDMKKNSVGTDITLQRIQLLQTTGDAGGVKIIDKRENGTAKGTTVIVSIPAKYQVHA